ncbi:hypothetical protein KIF53_18555 [Chromobacterium subtsugae]|uniref:A-factor biosynthesis hotdog domain-containing protein n=1 Tax=Chromobacterium subtsugae TaxID=251747 RepID=A0ABS7FHR9_9NEIS|nr:MULTISPECIES: AfsA-related hotdog domain-containing protein [Chromobacterium]KUM03274.1 hypothetical protein Cv017_20550 [Chromobacterium subtsugae]KZE85281.1 hypothetical protein AWB61_02555 [Chromobacterium sp. F49]MBW7568468.1 hypothetical protein [Chromobacterium subtsugae]MBW8289643.1 hypothetical protein [Chromobacterium subtsugae]OBU84990.1 hypothetical protein MY55_19310 [Chromobacterium subtsugae]
MTIQLIVADEFATFAQLEGVQTLGTLLAQLRSNQLEELRGSRLVAGQGLNQAQRDQVYALGSSLGLLEELSHWRLWSCEAPAGRALSHKHKAENILISTPRRVDAHHFEADLLLDAHGELLLDHLTGFHVQGMVLTEACRQMFIATTEAHCLDENAPSKRYFVINEMNMSFLEFAFPLPASIRYTVLTSEQPRPGRYNFSANMEVWQNGKPAASMAVKFAVFDDAYLAPRERQLAEKALNAVLEEARQALSLAPAEAKALAA